MKGGTQTQHRGQRPLDEEPRVVYTARDEASALPAAQQLQRGFGRLRFSPPALEQDFRAYYWRAYLFRTRYALLVGALVVCVFALRDFLTLPTAVWHWTAGLRLLLVVPAILLGVVFSLMPRLLPILERVFAVVVLVAMGGLAAGILISTRMGAALPYEGLMLMIVFTFFLSGLRTYKALASTMVAVIGFILASRWMHLDHAMLILRSYYLFSILVIGGIGAYSIEMGLRRNFLTEKLAEFRATRDPLTLLHNRRAVLDHLQRSWRLAVREQKPLAVLLLDVDDFKCYNDRNGHVAGDGCLSEVALAVADSLRRPMDMVARYGGEEFMAIAYGTGDGALRQICEELRACVENLCIAHPDGSTGPCLTISLGAAWATPRDGGNPFALIDAADRALYRAKEQGRNRWQISNPDELRQSIDRAAAR